MRRSAIDNIKISAVSAADKSIAILLISIAALLILAIKALDSFARFQGIFIA